MLQKTGTGLRVLPDPLQDEFRAGSAFDRGTGQAGRSVGDVLIIQPACRLQTMFHRWDPGPQLFSFALFAVWSRPVPLVPCLAVGPAIWGFQQWLQVAPGMWHVPQRLCKILLG